MNDIEFSTQFGAIRGWQSGVGKTIICFHGWQDNANSFVPLSKLLPNIQLISLDLPGHGLSDHLIQPFYNLWDYLPALNEVLNQIADNSHESLTIVGHSLGGILSLMLSTFRADISKAIVLDSLGGISVSEEKQVQNWNKSVQQINQLSTWPVYANEEEAITRRLNSDIQLSEVAATILCKRGLKVVDNGFTWVHDRKLLRSNPTRFTESMWLQILSSVKCSVKLYYGTEGWLNLIDENTINRRKSVIENFSEQEMLGNHYFHMDTGVKMLANCLEKDLTDFED